VSDYISIDSTNVENYVVSTVKARWSAAGDRILRYYVDIRHTKLNVHKEVSAPELFILQNKLEALVASWDEKYAALQLRQLLRSSADQASDMTIQAQVSLEKLGSILQRTLRVNDAIDWNSLKDHSPFLEKPQLETPKFHEPMPHTAELPQPIYVQPKVSFFDVLLGRKAAKVEQAERTHAQALADWDREEERRKQGLEEQVAAWEERRQEHIAAVVKANRAKITQCEQDEAEYLRGQSTRNAKVDALREALGRGDAEAVVEHASMVLDSSDYEGLFEKSFTIQYHPESKLLKIAYDIPSPDTLPTLKSVRFVKSTGELKETHISEREKKSNFEAVAYQVALRTLHELFEADEQLNIDQVLFNGYVSFIDRSTGQESRACLLSVMASREVFQSIDLSRIEPKACFKSLKGVSAASLASLAPIPPVMEMDREDRRFVEQKDVGGSIDEQTNLASISWEDFEHLVREVFEREFASRGGEVKVTRASSDGGVDAVAFDPDPITGGKIVIQAKRYTRTVGVSAVRDLYGTVMNEGAAKGILVTTADYGPDAYQFATGKPITLMTGANLLHLLERHGYKAKIDLKEARLAQAANARA
jgi:restriction system protein